MDFYFFPSSEYRNGGFPTASERSERARREALRPQARTRVDIHPIGSPLVQTVFSMVTDAWFCRKRGKSDARREN
jgi:hypothetical protein